MVLVLVLFLVLFLVFLFNFFIDVVDCIDDGVQHMLNVDCTIILLFYYWRLFLCNLMCIFYLF